MLSGIQGDVELQIVPSQKYPGFHYVIRIVTFREDEPGGAFLEGFPKPIRKDGIELFLNAICSGYRSFEWKIVETKPWPENFWFMGYTKKL
jgi:hypothetical protein